MKTLKSIGSVLAGFIIVALLSVVTDLILHNIGVYPDGALFDTKLLLLALLYRTVYTVIGGYITAKLAPSKPMTHAVVLTIIGIVMGSLGAVANADLGPAWYAWGIVVLSIPAIYIGAKLGSK